MQEASLRQDLLEFLERGPAHITLENALNKLKPENRNIRSNEHVHSIWEEMEHMRIAQEDILRYTLDEDWTSPPWPAGYWPKREIIVSEEIWQSTVKGFQSDLDRIIELVRNSDIDLSKRIPHGEGHSYLREVLLIIDHNAYHLGKIIQLRKMLGDWHK